MSIAVRHYDSFSTTPNMGNPAGVVLEADGMSVEDMQSVAVQVGFNETAFVLNSEKAHRRIRFFTPGHEIPLCGHATVASLIALYEHGLLPETSLPQSLAVETKAGVLPVGIKVEPSSNTVLIEMTQAPAKFVDFQGSKEDLAKSLGVQVSDFHPTLPIVYGSTGTWTLIVPCSNRSVVESMKPTSKKFPNVLTEIPRSSVHPFSMETVLPDADLHGRHFSSPYSGTVEDPITGTASGVMGAYLAKFAPSYCVEKNYAFTVEQGFEVGRRGQVQVEVLNRDEPFEVKIAGTGVYVQDLSMSLKECP